MSNQFKISDAIYIYIYIYIITSKIHLLDYIKSTFFIRHLQNVAFQSNLKINIIYDFILTVTDTFVVTLCSIMCIQKEVLKNFTKFTKKHLRQRLSFNKVIKKETLTQVFSCEFCKIFKSNFHAEYLQETTSELFPNPLY